MIDPNAISTIRVGQLPSLDFNLTDKIPHEVGTDLKSGTIQQLADFISSYIGVSSSIAFRAVTVLDGETLPSTTQEEWILVGKGTFYNVGGGATIVCTEELNAIMSNGTYWVIGVEIPINVELSGIVQTIRATYTDTAPSENAVFNALALKADVDDVPLALGLIDYPRLAVSTANFVIPTDRVAKILYRNGAPWFPLTANNASEPNTFTQSGNVVTTKTAQAINIYIVISYQ
jgi:hypothetical protein